MTDRQDRRDTERQAAALYEIALHFMGEERLERVLAKTAYDSNWKTTDRARVLRALRDGSEG